MANTLRPEESPGLLLWRTTLRWQQKITAALKPVSLTHVQFVVLASTWWLDRKTGLVPTQREIAEHAAIDPMMTSQVVRGLAGRGLVQRERDPVDARAFRISITDEGAILAEQAVQIVEQTDREFFAVIADRHTLITTLHALSSPPAPQ